MIEYLKHSNGFSNLVQGYSGFRPDIIKLIDGTPNTILDVGCGAGLLAVDLKKKFPDCHVTGLEANCELIQKASIHCDHVIKADLNNIKALEINTQFDVIVFADILEHLNHPEEVLKYLTTFLKVDGYIVTSLPNVRHYSTFTRLFIFGVWPQNSRGIHDKTHVNFFARKNIVRLLTIAGYEIDKEARNVRLLETQSWTNIPGKLFDFWPFRSFLTFQYLHRSKKIKIT